MLDKEMNVSVKVKQDILKCSAQEGGINTAFLLKNIALIWIMVWTPHLRLKAPANILECLLVQL